MKEITVNGIGMTADSEALPDGGFKPVVAVGGANGPMYIALAQKEKFDTADEAEARAAEIARLWAIANR